MMTWGEFVKWAKEKGVTPDVEIHYIDFSFKPENVAFNGGEVSIT